MARTESSWRRAWSDSEYFRKESPIWFWGVEVLGGLVAGGLGGWSGYRLLPGDPSNTQSFWYPTIGGIVGVLIGLGGIFLLLHLWNLLRAPYRQRDEAIQKVVDLEAKSVIEQIFEVNWGTTFLSLPLNKLDDGTFRASGLAVSGRPITIVHRGERVAINRVIVAPQVRFETADGKGWYATDAIRIAPQTNPMASPHVRSFTWDIGNPKLWDLSGLPIVMGKNEPLPLPMFSLMIADEQEAGQLLDSGDQGKLVVQISIRTDQGNPRLPDQVVSLTRSDIRDTDFYKEIMAQQGETKESS